MNITINKTLPILVSWYLLCTFLIGPSESSCMSPEKVGALMDCIPSSGQVSLNRVADYVQKQDLHAHST